MPDFIVLFDGPRGSGSQPVHALDPTHAATIVRACQPDASLKVIPEDHLEEGCNMLMVLQSWRKQKSSRTEKQRPWRLWLMSHHQKDEK